mmetsp:Transcript_9617/g.13323  ORF Transcript_9617/g.13323 Transcript_9617/m.13323 type:complete len:245 (-) Transcript_9617:11-745(-)
MFPLVEENCYSRLYCQDKNEVYFAGGCDGTCENCEFADKLHGASHACQTTKYSCVDGALVLLDCQTEKIIKRLSRYGICQDWLCAENDYSYSYSLPELISIEQNDDIFFTPTRQPTLQPTPVTFDESGTVPNTILALTSPPFTTKISVIALTIVLILLILLLLRRFLCVSYPEGGRSVERKKSRRAVSAASLDSGIEMLLRGEYGDDDEDDDDLLMTDGDSFLRSQHSTTPSEDDDDVNDEIRI